MLLFVLILGILAYVTQVELLLASSFGVGFIGPALQVYMITEHIELLVPRLVLL